MSSSTFASKSKKAAPAVCAPFIAEALGSSPAYQTKIVNEFRLTTDNATAAWVFKDLAALKNNASTSKSVNIRAYDQRSDNGNTSVFLVPGDSFGLPFDKSTQTNNDLLNTRKALRDNCVTFTETAALFVSAASVPGQLARVQALFNSADINVTSSYIDESTFSIYGVDNIGAAQAILGLSLDQQDTIIASYLAQNPQRKC